MKIRKFAPKAIPTKKIFRKIELNELAPLPLIVKRHRHLLIT